MWTESHRDLLGIRLVEMLFLRMAVWLGKVDNSNREVSEMMGIEQQALGVSYGVT